MSFPPLPNAIQGAVVTRFPPEPSGFLHIGHVKAALLNSHYARHYGGKLILRFDDTNPSKEKGDYVVAITNDLHRLGIISDVTTHTSDYFDLLIEKCEELLHNGNAFVDNTPVDEMRTLRSTLQPSIRRDNSIEENVRLWNEMKKGSEEGLKCCVRLKIDYAHPNGTMRDPTIYRCNLEPHIRTGTKYKVYPIYDFVCPIIDSLEGVTHCMRTNEYRERNPQYYYILDLFKLRRVEIVDFGRLNFEYTVMSKRLLTQFVDSGAVEGWNDPRFPTVQGIMRRGLTVEALASFIAAQGFSENIINMEWDRIWAMNKSVLEPTAARFNAVIDPVEVELIGEGVSRDLDWRSVALHPKNQSMGDKLMPYGPTVLISRCDAVQIKQGDKVTLMGWGNAFAEEIVVENGELKSIKMRLALDDKVFKKTLKLQWVTKSAHNVEILAKYYGYLINVKKVEDQKFEDIIERNSFKQISIIGEPALKNMPLGRHFQLQRLGFFIVDSAFKINRGMELIFIPSGRGELTIAELFPNKN
ncbi:hypothetical protein RCL1_006655 [Eukaryota sp. TZLM3-RCL]